MRSVLPHALLLKLYFGVVRILPRTESTSHPHSCCSHHCFCSFERTAQNEHRPFTSGEVHKFSLRVSFLQTALFSDVHVSGIWDFTCVCRIRQNCIFMGCVQTQRDEIRRITVRFPYETCVSWGSFDKHVPIWHQYLMASERRTLGWVEIRSSGVVLSSAKVQTFCPALQLHTV